MQYLSAPEWEEFEMEFHDETIGMDIAKKRLSRVERKIH